VTSPSRSSNQLLCRREDLDGAICLALTGELDLASVPTLQAHLKAVAKTDDNLIVDMSALLYIDSTGAKALLDAQRAYSRTGRRLGLAAASPTTRRILEVLGLETVLPMFPTVDAAPHQLRRRGNSKEER
jgi:anti-sigma B factor antagonist